VPNRLGCRFKGVLGERVVGAVARGFGLTAVVYTTRTRQRIFTPCWSTSGERRIAGVDARGSACSRPAANGRGCLSALMHDTDLKCAALLTDSRWTLADRQPRDPIGQERRRSMIDELFEAGKDHS